MSRLTLRLPDSLHRQLNLLASKEKISLNQFIVYALTRQATQDEQRVQFKSLLQSLGQATPEQIERVLDERERVVPESELTSDIVEALQQKIPQPAAQD